MVDLGADVGRSRKEFTSLRRTLTRFHQQVRFDIFQEVAPRIDQGRRNVASEELAENYNPLADHVATYKARGSEIVDSALLGTAAPFRAIRRRGNLSEPVV